MLRAFSPWRLRAIGWILTLSFLICAGRLYYLHIIANPKYQKISETNRIRLESHPAKRGEITDCNGELIATHQTRIVVGLDAQDAEGADEQKIKTLAKILGISAADVQEGIASGRRWTKLKEGVNESTYNQVRELKMKGVYGYPTYDRVYPKGAMAAHVVGFINKEGTATSGVERMMDFYLKGQDGWRETERDGKRRELGQFRSRDVAPKQGLNVELTLDVRVQAELEEQMRLIVQKYRPQAAAIIVSDPKTGFILGMSNYPTFDPNAYAKSPMANLKNHAISDMMEPGSTFKAVTVSAAIENHVVTPETVFDCGLETATYRGRELRLPKEAEHRFGKMNVRDIVAKSSNKGAAQIGMKMGEEMMYKYACDFGFGRTTGLGLTGESPGLLLQLKHWDGLTISRLPMGHAVAATPLQIHCAMSTIANNGVLMQPLLVRRVYDEDGKTTLEYAPNPRRQVISPATAALMRTLMIRTVSPEGTAGKAQIPGYEVAGKTGTTQKLVNGRYSSSQHIASFSGFFPARDPRLVITVIIDDPQMAGVGYGGMVAAPVFKDIASRLIQHLVIPPVEDVSKPQPKKMQK